MNLESYDFSHESVQHTPVPSYDGAKFYTVMQNLSAIASFKPDLTTDDGEYTEVLEEAGFTDYDPEEPGNGEYLSPKGQYKLRVEADDDYTGYFVISLNFDDIIDGTL